MSTIEQFQAQAYDWEGKPLKVDGQLGPRTKWALAIADLPRVRRDVVRIACAEVGAAEDPPGSNRGPRVDVYLAPTGLSGVPWCAAFCCWVLRQAGVAVKYTASARALLGQLHPIHADEALAGDLFGWVNADGMGHVGFVLGRAWVERSAVTCEGNSNDRVRNLQRPWDGLQFRRLPDVRSVNPTIDGLPLGQRQTQGTR